MKLCALVFGLLMVVGCGGEGESPGTTGATIPGPPYAIADILSVAPACEIKYADALADLATTGGSGSRVPCGITGTGVNAYRSSSKVYKYDLLCAKCVFKKNGMSPFDEVGCLADGDTAPYYCAASCGECGPPSMYVQP